MYECGKSFEFVAQHLLEREGYEAGKSRRQHGHRYICEVTFQSKLVPENGMIADLANLEPLFAEMRRELQLRILNDIMPVPTMEYIARWVCDHLTRNGWWPSKVIVGRPDYRDFAAYVP